MKPTLVDRPHCELCRSAQHKTLLRRPFTHPSIWPFLEEFYRGTLAAADFSGLDFEVAKCSDCGFIWQVHAPDERTMAAYYDAETLAEESLNKKRQADASLFARYARQVRAIAFLVPHRPSEVNVLDFGMGWGYWCRMAMAFGYNVTGFEVSPRRVEHARTLGVRTVGSLDPLPSQTFDFINSVQVFEHILEPLGTLARLVELLRPQGVIHIAVPDGAGIERKLLSPAWRATKDPLHPLEHVNCFTHATLLAMARSAGLEPEPEPILFSHRPALNLYLKDCLKYAWRHLRPERGTTLYFTKPG